VPAIVRWPGRIPPGSVSHQVGMTMDITASVLAVAGAAAPGVPLDGIDLFPILEGRAAPVERTLFWRAHAARQQRAVRSGNWKLVIDLNRPMLFDLATDIGERENVIARHTDVARRLHDQLLAWEREVGGGAKR
jgi:arylsulfatase A-like enzyme